MWSLQVVDDVNRTPGTSAQRVSLQESVVHSTVWRMLREQHLHPYHLPHVQALSLHDYPAWVMFCQWFLQRCGKNPNFLAFVTPVYIWSTVHKIWNPELSQSASVGRWKSNVILPSYLQQKLSISFWAHICGDNLFGSYLLPNRLMGQNY
jgi:hypothetical protein